MERVEQEGYNLNISRYISTAIADEELDLNVVSLNLISLEQQINEAKNTHNKFLRGLGLQELI